MKPTLSAFQDEAAEPDPTVWRLGPLSYERIPDDDQPAADPITPGVLLPCADRSAAAAQLQAPSPQLPPAHHELLEMFHANLSEVLASQEWVPWVQSNELVGPNLASVRRRLRDKVLSRQEMQTSSAKYLMRAAVEDELVGMVESMNDLPVLDITSVGQKRLMSHRSPQKIANASKRPPSPPGVVVSMDLDASASSSSSRISSLPPSSAHLVRMPESARGCLTAPVQEQHAIRGDPRLHASASSSSSRLCAQYHQPNLPPSSARPVRMAESASGPSPAPVQDQGAIRGAPPMHALQSASERSFTATPRRVDIPKFTFSDDDEATDSHRSDDEATDSHRAARHLQRAGSTQTIAPWSGRPKDTMMPPEAGVAVAPDFRWGGESAGWTICQQIPPSVRCWWHLWGPGRDQVMLKIPPVYHHLALPLPECDHTLPPAGCELRVHTKGKSTHPHLVFVRKSDGSKAYHRNANGWPFCNGWLMCLRV